MNKKLRLLMIPVILVIITAVIIMVPSLRSGAAGVWNGIFGSPKALEVGFYYTCPMHPQIRTSSPGECPICGMSLVKKEEKQGEIAAASIVLSDRQIQIGGIRKEQIKKRNLTKVIESVGKVAYDPELYIAQQEYLQAVKTAKMMSPQSESPFLSAAEKKLLLLGMSKEQIEEMVKIGKPQESLYLPTTGDAVWIYITVYEYDIGLIKEGLPIEATLVAFPGEVFTGKISSIIPILNSETRSLQVRAQVRDSAHKLKPEMYARVQIKISKGNILSVPESAVIYTGKRNIVFVTDGHGTFTPKLLTLGAQWLYDNEFASSEDKALPFHRGMGRYHEVLKGLTTDDVVVTSGNFLVDAESQIQGAMQMFLKDLPEEVGDKSKSQFDENAPFICPMKCESSDKSGKCSKCGMNLEPNPAKDKTKQEEPVNKEQGNKAKPPLDEKVLYICPMKCEISDKAGECSKCGMMLVPNPATESPKQGKPANKDDENKSKQPSDKKILYICPMKCEISDKPGKCSECGMKLVPDKPEPEQKH